MHAHQVALETADGTGTVLIIGLAQPTSYYTSCSYYNQCVPSSTLHAPRWMQLGLESGVHQQQSHNVKACHLHTAQSVTSDNHS